MKFYKNILNVGERFVGSLGELSYSYKIARMRGEDRLESLIFAKDVVFGAPTRRESIVGLKTRHYTRLYVLGKINSVEDAERYAGAYWDFLEEVEGLREKQPLYH